MLRNKAITGVIWNSATQAGAKLVGLVTVIVLARMLTPEDFGVVAMMAVFIAVASQLMNSGIGQAVIRKSEVTEVDKSTAFCTCLMLSVLAYGGLYVLAPLVAEFYREEMLIELIRVVAFVLPISALIVVPRALLSRRLEFKTQWQVQMIAALVAAVGAVTAAYAGCGVWAIILQIVLTEIVAAVGYLTRGIWRPKVGFDLSAFTAMYGFGVRLFVTGLIDTIYKNVVIVVLAKVYAPDIVGSYYFAERIKNTVIRQMVGPIQNVSYPALSVVNRNGNQLMEGFERILQGTMFLTFPVLAMIGFMAEPLFTAILPEKWNAAAVYLPLLCAVGIMNPLHAANVNILKVIGRSDVVMYLAFAKKIVAIAFLGITYRYGVVVILAGQLMAAALNTLPHLYMTRRLIGYGAIEQIKVICPTLILAVGAAAASRLFVAATGIENGPGVILVAFMALLAYLIIGWRLNLKSHCVMLSAVKTYVAGERRQERVAGA